MTDHDNDTPATPSLAELNRHLFAAMLPETHVLPEQAEAEQEPAPKKAAAKGKAAAPTNDE